MIANSVVDSLETNQQTPEYSFAIATEENHEVKKLRNSILSVIHTPSSSSSDAQYWATWAQKYKNVDIQTLIESAQNTSKTLLNNDAHMLRILIARKHNVKLSTDLFIEQVKWRAKWQPQKIDHIMIPHALKSGAWRLCGYSKEGCIISNYKLSHWKPDDYGSNNAESSNNAKDDLCEAVHEYVRYIAYMIELMIGKMTPLPSPQQFVVLFDLKGFTTDLLFNKKAREMIKRLIYVAQSQYPERLRKVYLINAPWGFSTAWKLIESILDPKTTSKISFASGDLVKAMGDHLDKDTLSVSYGGSHKEYNTPSLSLQDEIKLEIR